VHHCEEINRIRGQVDFSQSINRTFMRKPSLVCEYDEFDYNVLHNRILKTTIHNLLRCSEVDAKYSSELKMIYRRFSAVDEIRLSKRTFGMVSLNRNNKYYDFIMKVCELIYDCLLPSEDCGKYLFDDFRKKNREMNVLFEAFVKNFYHLEQQKFQVKSEWLDWEIPDWEQNKESSLLPKMRTDVSLTSEHRKIILDTKFYEHTLQENFGNFSIRSGHLYQIFSYIMNDKFSYSEGILLYPTNSVDIDRSWQIKQHSIKVKTINLNQEWEHIRSDLLAIIE
jgi:5-methylcytosine-specific restriction enzyme subunit McrC